MKFLAVLLLKISLYTSATNYNFERELKYMKKYKIASILMFIHGAFMEVRGCLCLIPVFVMGSDKFDINQYISFIVPYFKDNMNLMLVMGAIYGIVRIIGAVGL